jgi:hypothetical protein
MTQERDFDAHPYSADEERVAAWMRARAPDIGTGDDPIGFLLASYEYTWLQRDAARTGLRFFASVIKSGEAWTETCETEYRKATDL